MVWGKDKSESKKKTEDIEVTIVCCNSCGYRGPMEDFLKTDAGDTRCPQCDEDDDLIYEM